MTSAAGEFSADTVSAADAGLPPELRQEHPEVKSTMEDAAQSVIIKIFFIFNSNWNCKDKIKLVLVVHDSAPVLFEI